MSRRRFTLLLLTSTSVTMAASCAPTVVLPPGMAANPAAIGGTPPAAVTDKVATRPVVAKPTTSPPPFPQLVAHRGGTKDKPENTLVAIESALANHADMIWLTVQLSADGVPVLYRPTDLASLTDGKGPVAGMTFARLQSLNAGWTFTDSAAGQPAVYPYRAHPVRMPSLRQALHHIPATVPVVLDMKALSAEAQAEAVAKVLQEEGAWGRVLIYSTEAAYQRAFSQYPKARVFESRDATRKRLVDVSLGGRCDAPGNGTWAGFELRRNVIVSETFTLGKAETPAVATLWNPRSVACYRSRNAVNLIAFGVNDEAAYCEAMRLGLDAVMVDSPARMSAIRARLQASPAPCAPTMPSAPDK